MKANRVVKWLAIFRSLDTPARPELRYHATWRKCNKLIYSHHVFYFSAFFILKVVRSKNPARNALRKCLSNDVIAFDLSRDHSVKYILFYLLRYVLPFDKLRDSVC